MDTSDSRGQFSLLTDFPPAKSQKQADFLTLYRLRTTQPLSDLPAMMPYANSSEASLLMHLSRVSINGSSATTLPSMVCDKEPAGQFDDAPGDCSVLVSTFSPEQKACAVISHVTDRHIREMKKRIRKLQTRRDLLRFSALDPQKAKEAMQKLNHNQHNAIPSASPRKSSTLQSAGPHPPMRKGQAVAAVHARRHLQLSTGMSSTAAKGTGISTIAIKGTTVSIDIPYPKLTSPSSGPVFRSGSVESNMNVKRAPLATESLAEKLSSTVGPNKDSGLWVNNVDTMHPSELILAPRGDFSSDASPLSKPVLENSETKIAKDNILPYDVLKGRGEALGTW
jgi:hypothetical protein